MKSALELAMERADSTLDGKDIKLTDEQKRAIDDIKKTYAAKLAEQEINLQSRLAKATRDAEPQQQAQARTEVEREMARLRDELTAERDAKIEAVRQDG